MPKFDSTSPHLSALTEKDAISLWFVTRAISRLAKILPWKRKLYLLKGRLLSVLFRQNCLKIIQAEITRERTVLLLFQFRFNSTALHIDASQLDLDVCDAISPAVWALVLTDQAAGLA
jgi:hypothetical protein